MSVRPHRLWEKLLKPFPHAVLGKDRIDFGGHCLRFALGAPHPNGSLKRVVQATTRATQLYRELFSGSRSMLLIIYDWDASGKEINPSDPPGYVFSLIHGFAYDRTMLDKGVKAKTSKWSRLFIYTTSAALDARRLFRAIANNEQGRVPCINQKVYCVDLDSGVAFHMYDDRGCLVNLMDKDRWLVLQNRRRTWLAE